jgi:Na+-transporting methylmalonyl-CoA/oxaloacetate decarboxylase gamma subunit
MDGRTTRHTRCCRSAGPRQCRAVFGRRALLFIVVLLLIVAVSNAIAPRERNQAVKPPPSARPAAAPDNVVRATLPARREVRAKVGSIVEIAVRHDRSDTAQIPALGVEAPVEAGLPAQLIFDADRPGRFAVTLRDAARRVGIVEVRDGS